MLIVLFKWKYITLKENGSIVLSKGIAKKFKKYRFPDTYLFLIENYSVIPFALET